MNVAISHSFPPIDHLPDDLHIHTPALEYGPAGRCPGAVAISTGNDSSLFAFVQVLIKLPDESYTRYGQLLTEIFEEHDVAAAVVRLRVQQPVVVR
jgi:hypothetical protein